MPLSIAHPNTLPAIVASLKELRTRLDAATTSAAPLLASVHACHRESAKNLVHYVAARQIDLRSLQLELWKRGLSSLGRLEGHVADTVDRVLGWIDTADQSSHNANAARPPIGWDEAEQLLHRNTRALLGPQPKGRHVYVMVTAPTAREVSEQWLSSLLDAGMNVLRINAAHESAVEWRHIAHTASTVAEARGLELRILVDLPGPKLRTVACAAGPGVVKWRPTRDALGRVTASRRIVLREAGANARPDAQSLEVPGALLTQLAAADRLTFHDARGKQRHLIIDRSEQGALVGLLDATAYIINDVVVSATRAGRELGTYAIGGLPPRAERVHLHEGDRLRLTHVDEQAETGAPTASPAAHDGLPTVGCPLAAALLSVRAGERVLFDDGKLSCVCESEAADAGGGLMLRVIQAPPNGLWLGAEKGINLPDSRLEGPVLSEADREALAFAVEHADLVGASFLRDATDVRDLLRELEPRHAAGLGIVLKIETVSAFRALPEMLLLAMRRERVGVMIARGDLAVEAGFERLAELQEEILCVCEAAHLPVVWATQVLDTLARTGQPTRAEISDAAMSVRAECVMLNKGPFVAHAVKTLVDILQRMESHQYKKRSLYRKLNLSLPGGPGPET